MTKLTGAHSDPSGRQEFLDSFYHRNGPCCAGCDWWHSLSANVGECHRSAMVSGEDRMLALGIDQSSLAFGAGHAITERQHVCGEFKDEFDWSSLPLPYRRRVGAPVLVAGRSALSRSTGRDDNTPGGPDA